MSNLKQEPIQHLLSLIQQLQFSNSQLTAMNERYRKEISQRDRWSKTEIGLLLEQNARLLSQKGKLQSLIQKVTQKAMQREQMVRLLQARIMQFQESISEIQKEYGGYFTEISQYKIKVGQLQQKNNKLKSQLKQVQIRNQYLSNELEYKRKQLNSRSVNRRATSPRRSQVKLRSPPKQNKKQYEQLKQQIETSIATLDQINSLSQHQQSHMKEQLEKNYQQFIRVKEECKKMRIGYEDEILKLKKENQILLADIAQSVQGTRDGNSYYLEILTKCLEHKLPYIQSIKDSVPKQVSLIVKGIYNIYTQLEQNLNQSKETRVDQIVYTQQILKLQNQIQMIHQKYTHDAERLNEDLLQLEEQRNNMIECLKSQIQQQKIEIAELQTDKQEILRRIHDNNRISERNVSQELLEINDENILLKIKNFEIIGLLEALLYLFANVILDWERKQHLNRYYRIYEKYYWETNPTLKTVTHSKTLNSSPLSKFKKGAKAVLFLCILKNSKARKLDSQKLVLSDLKQQCTNKKFLSLLSKHNNFGDRCENRVVQEFKQKQKANMFQELVSMINVEIGNEKLKRLDRQQIGWNVYEMQMNNVILNFTSSLNFQNKQKDRKIMVNSRSAGSFRKTKWN